jgi:uncharacterized protein (DUF1778 family)
MPRLRLDVRVTSRDLGLLRESARARGMSLGEFVADASVTVAADSREPLERFERAAQSQHRANGKG